MSAALAQSAPEPSEGPVVVRRLAELETFKIKDADTNYFALIADPIRDRTPFMAFVEVFEPGGRTPWHHHGVGHEMFFVLSGEGKSVCDGEEIPLKKGDSFIVRPGNDHEVVNTGTEKLYCLTLMVPNDGFAELVRSGFRVPLTDDDKTVIGG